MQCGDQRYLFGIDSSASLRLGAVLSEESATDKSARSLLPQIVAFEIVEVVLCVLARGKLRCSRQLSVNYKIDVKRRGHWISGRDLESCTIVRGAVE
jgi:hypothetical protein